MRLLKEVQRFGQAGSSVPEVGATAKSVLREWNISVPAQDVPVLLMPLPIAYLMSAGAWKYALLLARWHRRFTGQGWSRTAARYEGPRLGWPPRDAALWAHVGESILTKDAPEVTDMTAGFLGWALQQFRVWSQEILRHSTDAATEEPRLSSVASALQGWQEALLACNGLVPPVSVGRRFVYSSQKLVQCIRLAAGVKGGADNLASVAERSLALVAPRFLAGPMLEGWNSSPGLHNAIPSATTLRRYEIALDISLILTQRHRAHGHPTFKFAHADSSPIAGFDWLWTQWTEIGVHQAPSAYVAICKLAGLAKELRDAADALPEDDDDCPVSAAVNDPPQHWKQFNQIINNSFHEVVNPPTSLGSGHRSLSSKAAALVFAMALHCPEDIPLSEFAEGFRCMTTDMGVEFGLADFHILDHAELLPEWVRSARCPVERDCEESESASAEGEIGSACTAVFTPTWHESVGSQDADGPMLSDSGSDDRHDDPADAGSRAGVVAVEAEPCSVASPVVAEPVAEDCAQPEPRRLLHKAFTFPGLQHISNNLCSDVHKSLSHWGQFWKDIKNLESLLSVDERRSRFVACCLRGSALQHLERKFKSFKSSPLYEPRWKAVLSFLNAAEALLPIIAAVWDAGKYTRGVDDSEEARPAQAAAQRKQEEQRGIAKFDVQALTTSLRSGLFWFYFVMCGMLERVPPALAAFGECCPCHEALVRDMTEYKRRMFFERIFGPGIHCCPCAGMVAPELIAGRLDLEKEKAFRDLCAELQTLQPLPKGAMPTDSEWQIINRDLEHGQAVMVSLLQQKTQFCKALPWLLCGIAHTDLSVARRYAQLCIDRFEEDPRQVAQHRISWELLRRDSYFRRELECFISGSDIAQLSADFVRQIATFRFCIVVETTVEAKHSRVTSMRRQHAAGPVRVSLSNRLPLMERWLKRGQLDMVKLVHYFDQSRKIVEAAKLLNLEDHPCLVGFSESKGRGQKDSKVLYWLTKVLYGVALESMYRSTAKAGKHDATLKRKAKDMETKLLRSGPRATSFQALEAELMRDHMAQRFSTDYVYSCSSSILLVQPLASCLQGPRSKRARLLPALDGPVLALEDGASDPIQCDVEIEAQVGDILYFKVVSSSFGNKKTVKMPMGAGGRIEQNALTLTMHDHIEGAEDPPIVSSRPTRTDGTTHVLHGWDCPNVIMKEFCTRYVEGRVFWTLPVASTPEGFSQLQVLQLSEKLMRAGSYYGIRHVVRGIALREEEQALALDLAVGPGLPGFCEVLPNGTWVLSELGTKALSACRALSSPQLLFDPRAGVPEEELTPFELVQKLIAEGWVWKLWKPLSKRCKRDGAIPKGFLKGQPKVWYAPATSVPSKPYLLCILNAEVCRLKTPTTAAT